MARTRATRLEAMKVSAGGAKIHLVNQHLFAVKGYLSLAKTDGKFMPDLKKAVDEAEEFMLDAALSL